MDLGLMKKVIKAERIGESINDEINTPTDRNEAIDKESPVIPVIINTQEASRFKLTIIG